MNVHVYEGSHTTLAAFEGTVHLVVAWSLLTGDEHTGRQWEGSKLTRISAQAASYATVIKLVIQDDTSLAS